MAQRKPGAEAGDIRRGRVLQRDQQLVAQAYLGALSACRLCRCGGVEGVRLVAYLGAVINDVAATRAQPGGATRRVVEAGWARRVLPATPCSAVLACRLTR